MAYPRFHDGDVFILSPAGQSWTLHSQLLFRFCPALNELVQRDTGHMTKKQKIDPNSNIRYKLIMTPEDEQEWFVNFTAVDPHAKHGFTLPSNGNGRAQGAKPEYLTTYDNLFRCIYYLEPDLEVQGIPNQFTHRSILLLRAADSLGAIASVRRPVETHLLRLGQELWYRLYALPVVFADLAIRMQSPAVFKQALVHIIGAYHLPGGMSRIKPVDDNARVVREIARRKVMELLQVKRDIEEKLITFVPPSMSKTLVGGKAPGRSDYAADIYHWQALTLIRQYMAQALFDGEGRDSPDGGAAFYRKVNAGNYLPKAEWSEFLNTFPMSSKAELVFEERMNLLKKEFSVITAPLLISHAEPLPAANGPIPYLTVGTVEEADFPWNKEGSAEPVGTGRASEVPPSQPVHRRKAPQAAAVSGPSAQNALSSSLGEGVSSTPRKAPASAPKAASNGKTLSSGARKATGTASRANVVPVLVTTGSTASIATPGPSPQVTTEPTSKVTPNVPRKISREDHGSSAPKSRAILKPVLRKVAGTSTSKSVPGPSAQNANRSSSVTFADPLAKKDLATSSAKAAPNQPSQNNLGSSSSGVALGKSSSNDVGSSSKVTPGPSLYLRNDSGPTSSQVASGPSNIEYSPTSPQVESEYNPESPMIHINQDVARVLAARNLKKRKAAEAQLDSEDDDANAVANGDAEVEDAVAVGDDNSEHPSEAKATENKAIAKESSPV